MNGKTVDSDPESRGSSLPLTVIYRCSELYTEGKYSVQIVVGIYVDHHCENNRIVIDSTLSSHVPIINRNTHIHMYITLFNKSVCH